MHESGGVLDIILLTFGLLFMAAVINVVARKIRFPFTVALVIVGLSVGIAARFFHEGHGILGKVAGALSDFELTADVVLFLFLPTLIYESAHNLDVRKLLQNLAPILALAIPGLLISTVLIGAIMTFGLGMAWLIALLFGAMISATDPVAVIAIFKDVGAPKRLLTLVEGESLFNDATAIVVFGLILSLMQGAAASAPMVLVRFLYVFVGGSVVGVLLGMLFAKVIEKVENDQVVEITLTTVLAYLSFIVAEHWLHVSGVMSTVGAGLCMGSYGRTKVSPQVREFMHSFWEYMAFVANAIIFLLVGLYLPQTVAGMGLGGLVLPLLLALGAALLARAVVVFGCVPILGKLRMGEIDRRYQAVIFWGGLRGAIALALALSLLGNKTLPEGRPEFLLALTAGVVLFTLLVNATTIRKVVHATGLDQETSAERFVKVGSMLDVQHEVARDLEGLKKEAIFLPRVLDGLIRANRERESELRGTLVTDDELSTEEILTVHRLQCVAVEKNHYLRLQSEGNLSEPATRDLMHEADVRADQIRRGRPILVPYRSPRDKSRFLAPLLRAVPFLRPLAQRLQIGRVAHLYEMARGRFLAATEVLAELGRQRGARAIDDDSLQALDKRYLQRRAEAEESMDEVTEQFPEFVVNVQEIVGARLALNTEREGYDRLYEQGLMGDEIHGRLVVDLDQRLRTLRRRPVKALDLDPRALLANVPLFSSLSKEELDSVAACLAPRSCLKGEILFREGQQGDRMFLIGRGVVKVWRGEEDRRQMLGTLTAGSFVGEMALLHPAPRVATAQTATVASLMELKKADLDKVLERFPQVREHLEKAYRQRLADLSG